MKKVVALAVASAFAVPAAAQAAPSEMKVTGGGKTVDGATIALVAQGNPSTAKGQMQYNDHQGTKLHGVVTCVYTFTDSENGGNYFEVAGKLRDGTVFNVKGTDSGQGPDSGDAIALDTESGDSDCDGEPADAYDDLGDLAHGNIRIHRVREGDTSSGKQRRADMRAAKRTARASQFNALRLGL